MHADLQQERVGADWEKAQFQMNQFLTVSRTVRAWCESHPETTDAIRMYIDPTMLPPLSEYPRAEPVGPLHRNCSCSWRLHEGYREGFPWRQQRTMADVTLVQNPRRADGSLECRMR